MDAKTIREWLDSLVIESQNNLPQQVLNELAGIVDEIKRVIGDTDNDQVIMDKISAALVPRLVHGNEAQKQAAMMIAYRILSSFSDVINVLSRLRGLFYFLVISAGLSNDTFTAPGGVIGLDIFLTIACKTIDEALRGRKTQPISINVTRPIHDTQVVGLYAIARIGELCRDRI